MADLKDEQITVLVEQLRKPATHACCECFDITELERPCRYCNGQEANMVRMSRAATAIEQLRTPQRASAERVRQVVSDAYQAEMVARGAGAVGPQARQISEFVDAVADRVAAELAPASHLVQVARAADALGADPDAEAIVDRAIAKAQTGAQKRKLAPAVELAPVLSAEERASLRRLRDNAPNPDHDDTCDSCRNRRQDIAVLDRLLEGGR